MDSLKLQLHDSYEDYVSFEYYKQDFEKIQNITNNKRVSLILIIGERFIFSHILFSSKKTHIQLDLLRATLKLVAIVCFLHILIVCSENIILIMQMKFNTVMCFINVLWFHYDMVNGVIVLGVYLSISDNVLIKPKAVGGVNMKLTTHLF